MGCVLRWTSPDWLRTNDRVTPLSGLNFTAILTIPMITPAMHISSVSEAGPSAGRESSPAATVRGLTRDTTSYGCGP